jgi:hypothetical protein
MAVFVLVLYLFLVLFPNGFHAQPCVVCLFHEELAVASLFVCGFAFAFLVVGGEGLPLDDFIDALGDVGDGDVPFPVF